MGMTIPEDATRIIKMMEAVTIEELGNDEEYADIVEDMRDESNKVRRLHSHLLHQPSAVSAQPTLTTPGFGDPHPLTSARAARMPGCGRAQAHAQRLAGSASGGLQPGLERMWPIGAPRRP